jgi:hypothetical protein
MEPGLSQRNTAQGNLDKTLVVLYFLWHLVTSGMMENNVESLQASAARLLLQLVSKQAIIKSLLITPDDHSTISPESVSQDLDCTQLFN